MHVNNGSIWQVESQPSLLTRLPSSQPSGLYQYLSPHTVRQFVIVGTEAQLKPQTIVQFAP